MTTQTEAQQAALQRTQDARRARIDARIEDLEFLLENGVPAREAVARVGWTVQGAERALHRRGLRSLARAVYAGRAA